VNVELLNATEQRQTFHLALETGSGMLDWESHPVDAGVDEAVTLTPDGATSLVAVHGAVNDFSGSVSNLDPDGPDGEYCLHFRFQYPRSMDEDPQLAQIADIHC